MKILIVSATWMEVKMIADELSQTGEKSDILKQYRLADKEIDILISGIGTIFTTFHLTRVLVKKDYDLVISVGIAGSLSNDLKIGEVVNVVSEEFADLGIENNSEFLTLFESGFLKKDDFPFENGLLKATDSNGLLNMKKVHGITANKSHGNRKSIEALVQKYAAHVETMEGAAVFYVCNQLKIPCYQVRAISNYVEPRDPSKWNIPLALENLKLSILQALQNLAVQVN